MAENLSQLKSKRASVKGKLTRFRHFCDKLDKDNLSKVELNEVQLRLEKIDPAVFQEYETIQESIEMIDFEESADRDLFENMYFQLISEVKTLLNVNDKAMLDGSNLDALSDVSSQHSHRSQYNPSDSLVRLPPIKLPVFDGHYQNWLEFKDTFSALVHNNESLSGIQKFYYLRSSLDKSVEQVIKNIEISERNYETAWAFLLSRYENKNLMIFNHLREMFEFPVQKEESHIKLRNLYDTFSKHLRSLDTLGEKTDTWDSPMIYLMASKFDPITKREWEMYKYKGEVPSLIDVNDFLKQKCEALERLAVSKPENKFKFGKTKSHGFVSTNDQSNITCYYCKKGHKIYQCESFLKLSIDNRCAWVNNSKLCTLCLRDNHTALVCKARKYPRCQKAHNSVLCRVSSAGQTRNVNSNRSADDSGAVTAAGAEVSLAGTDTEPRPIAMAVVSNEGNSFHCRAASGSDVAKRRNLSQVLLSTALVAVNNGTESIYCRTLLDSGSQSNFVSRRVCQKLGLRSNKINHAVKGVGNTLAKISDQVTVTVESRYKSFTKTIDCLVLDKITEKLPFIPFDKEKLGIPTNLFYADPDFNDSTEIDLLLGSDTFWAVLMSGKMSLGKNMPVLQETEFGWVIAGNMFLNFGCNVSLNCFSVSHSDNQLNDSVRKFWEIEEIVNKNKALSVDERYCEEYFEKTFKRNEEGRCIVKIPFKDSVKLLGDSRETALNRFLRLEKRLLKDSALKERYVEFMKEYHELGHMVESEEEIDGFYLPHHPVIKETSLTTKTRVVFDATRIIREDFYMDDLLTGSDSKDELLCIQHEITKLLSDYGFQLRKWLCNEPKLLNEFNVDSKIDVSVLNIEDEACKTLGVFWDAKNDQIKYTMNNHGTNREFYTKRTVLSIISQLFDPLGLLGPIIINAKLIMQELWKEQVGWDEELPKNINKKWIHFKNDLAKVNEINIPRHAFFSVYIAVELHGFCDSSILAYGACIYIRCSLCSNQFYSQLLCAKSRVAPLKQVSLPRLELCGCVLLANLAKKVKESLRINFNKHYFWTDSMIALAWIDNNPTKWKTFIANRVSEIQSLTNTTDWHHVKSQENPADLLSRGTTVNALSHSDLWWFGPAWLQTNNQNWEICEPVCMSDLPEMRTVCNLSVNESNVTLNYILNKFSSLETMLKVVAYVLRFTENMKLPRESRKLGALTPEEIDVSMQFLIKQAQRDSFQKEYDGLLQNKIISSKSKLVSLNPFMLNGLIRVSGRLKNSNESFERRHPIILPKGHILTKLILTHEHVRLLHGGVQALLSNVRERYWPIAGRNVCKDVVRKCITCFKCKPRDLRYFMGDLPEKIYEFLSLQHENIANRLAVEKIKWSFIPARSPTFGSIWEAGIKSVKHHIRRVIGNKALTFEEFATVLTQIEAVLNSRPLCPLSEDPDDVNALTPGHFIIGKNLTSLPEYNINAIAENRLTKWQHMQQMVQHYWQRWRKEYLSELQSRMKWKQRYPELLKIGSLVVVKEDKSPPCSWPLGRVVALYPGQDGFTRVVKLKLKSGEVTRAINRICVLPLEC
nr:unnamed protein product [Callosobruchus analis]